MRHQQINRGAASAPITQGTAAVAGSHRGVAGSHRGVAGSHRGIAGKFSKTTRSKKITGPSNTGAIFSAVSWRPDAVTDAACSIYANAVAAKAPPNVLVLVARLASDPRMKGVWRKLKTKDTAGRYRYPCQLPEGLDPRQQLALSYRLQADALRDSGGDDLIRLLEAGALASDGRVGTDDDARQAVAMALVFHHAVDFAASGMRTVTRGEITRWRRPARREAARDREHAALAWAERRWDDAEKLFDAALVHERYAAAIGPEDDDPLVVGQQRRDITPQTRGYILALTATMRSLFREQFRPEVAAICSVAFGLNLKAKDIRNRIRRR
jgi:hypothetical protein